MLAHPKTIWLPLVAACFAACASPVASDAWPTQVLQADLARVDAMLRADAAQLERLLHDDLTYTHSNAVTDTKQSLIAALVANVIDYQSMETSSPAVRLQGSTAIVTGMVKMQVSADRQVHDLRNLYTAVYWRIDNRWQLVAYQSTPIGPG